MKKVILTLILLLFFACISIPKSFAIFDPLSKKNNDIGIHILYPDEVFDAARLVNSTGGDWGYVTIPIQVGDRDQAKWQTFMDNCYTLHLIPIMRLATEADPQNTNVWRAPTQFDVLDFANFFNSLTWPTKNRYIILFNEVNRSDEWGGTAPDPESYSDLVSYSIDTFKRRSDDFFMIMGGMDNAAPNQPPQFLDEYTYYSRMISHNPVVFQKIDGLASHSYPNPNFAQAPSNAKNGIETFKTESDYINSLVNVRKPEFITETGWNGDILSQDTIAKYFTTALSSIWSQDKNEIVAITPFLLRSNGAFDKFSFIKNGQDTAYFKAVEEFPKEKGQPDINVHTALSNSQNQGVLGTETLNTFSQSKKNKNTSPLVNSVLKLLFGI